MIVTVQRNDAKYLVDLSKGIDCSSTLGDKTREPSAWYVDPVKISAVENGDWVGAVARGGSVNFFNVQLNPHGNGTHTECYGHIDAGHQKIGDHFNEYHGWVYFSRVKARVHHNDLVVRWQDLSLPNGNLPPFFAIDIEGVAFPQNFSNTNPAYLEPQLCAMLAKAGVRHLLLNLPSVDKEEDGGALAAHRAFWQYPEQIREKATITELAHFPKNLEEGFYFINLQVAPLYNDAAPSRPVLYPCEKV
jgi:arylformamidase